MKAAVNGTVGRDELLVISELSLYLNQHFMWQYIHQNVVFVYYTDFIVCLSGVLLFGFVNGAAVAAATVRFCSPYLIDLDSTNGCFINNQRVDPQRYYELKEQVSSAWTYLVICVVCFAARHCPCHLHILYGNPRYGTCTLVLIHRRIPAVVQVRKEPTPISDSINFSWCDLGEKVMR